MTRYCSQCGAESLPGSFCPGCGAWVERVETEVDPRVAGFGIRAVARVLDNVVALVVGIVAAFSLSVAVFQVSMKRGIRALTELAD